MGSFVTHVLTLLHRIIAKCQISCGDIEMAKQRLGQTKNNCWLGKVACLHIPFTKGIIYISGHPQEVCWAINI